MKLPLNRLIIRESTETANKVVIRHGNKDQAMNSKWSVLPGIVVLLGLVLPLHAQSVYTTRLEDPQAIYVGSAHFPIDSSGDDSTVIQAAIDAAEAEHVEGIVFVPEGRYRITRTIYVWPGVRIIGYGAHRPVFVLPDNTPGYQKNLGYMFLFAGARPDTTHAQFHFPSRPDQPATPGTVPPNNTIPDANPGTFYSAMSNVDFDLGSGNPAAVAIRFHVAQHCYLSHIDFHIRSGLAALKDIGNEGEDLHFYGGKYGIVTISPSPGWQYTLLDSAFEGQSTAAIKEHEAGLTLVHDSFRNVPQAIDIDAGYPDELWIENSRFEDISGPAITVSDEKNARTEINIVNAACHNVRTLVHFRDDGQNITGPAEDYEVRSFEHGLTMRGPGDAGEIRTSLDTEPSPSLPSLPAAIRPLPPENTWINLRSLGAKGDGVTDDTAAIRKAVAENPVLYVPMGRYVVTGTIKLRPDTVLIGFHPSMTQFDVPDGTLAFQGPGTPVPLLEAPRGGHTIVTGIGLYTGGANSRAVGALWMAGADSLMDDVRFLGGHGTNAPDGSRINPYNNTHTADPDIRNRWDGQYPSLWVTNGGGGTFADIWTPNTFAQAGMYVSDTDTPGHVYELSSEHHVRNEVTLVRVKDWEIDALQTEEERGESPFALPLSIEQSSNITIANYHGYRVVSSYQPFPFAIKVSESSGIRFRNVHVNSNSKVSFDDSIFDATHHEEVRAREFASLDVPGVSAPSPLQSDLSSILPESARVKLLATGFFSISGAAVDPLGQLYFVDAHWQRIYRWSSQNSEAVVVRDNPLDPINLAFDRSGDLLVVSYQGNGTVYTFRPGSPETQMTLLRPGPSQPRPGIRAFLPVSVWSSPDLTIKTPWQYVSPDGSIFIPASDSFVNGELRWGTKLANVLHASSLEDVVPGHPVYITVESDQKTYKVDVQPDGSFGAVTLFAEDGGEAVAQDMSGNVYLAGEQVLVYSPDGKLLGRIDVPERPIDLIFGGADHRTLYILTHTSLYAVQTKISGL
jgi:sugar lactone lactonase YvrE